MEKASVSFVKGKGSISHNNRVFSTPNVDTEKTKYNIVYKQESLEDAYEKCFGKAIEDYNANQKRADRRIDGVQGYMNQVQNSKNGEKLFYENVVQVGNMYDCHVGTPKGDVCKHILSDYMRDFEKRNPNLYVFNAVLHMDEQTPHLHIDYIPLAHGYQKGLSVRNSLDRALKEQGIDGKSNKFENSTNAWQEREKSAIADCMREHGLERAEESGLKRKHMGLEDYKTVVQTVENEIKQIPQKIEYREPKFGNKDVVQVQKADLKALERRAKLSEVHKNNSTQMEIQTEKMKLSSADELKSAYLLKREYEELYENQTSLNERYDTLMQKCKEQEHEIAILNLANSDLKAENEELRLFNDEKVQKAVKPLKEQIKELDNKLEKLGNAFIKCAYAYNMFIRSDETSGLRLKLTEKQMKLFSGIESFVKKTLKDIFGARADEPIAEMGKKCMVSDEIKQNIKESSIIRDGWER